MGMHGFPLVSFIWWSNKKVTLDVIYRPVGKSSRISCSERKGEKKKIIVKLIVYV